MWCLLSILVYLLHSVDSQAGLAEVPGIDDWKEAIQQHRLAEGKVGAAAGLPDWEAHQKAVLEAEKKLQESGEVVTGKQGEKDKVIKISDNVGKNIEENEKKREKSSKKPSVAGGFTDIVKSSIKKLLAKLSGKDTSKTSAGKELQTRVETLLEKTREEKIQQGNREYSYLDKLVDEYGKEKESPASERDILQLFKRKYKNKKSSRYRNRQRALRRERYRDRFAFLSDYDYQEPPRKPSYLRILNGDYLSLVSNYDDYDYGLYDERDYLEDLFDERGSASALIESKLLERQLKRFLRNS